MKSTASVMQEYTQWGGVRPFGVSLLVAGMDGDGVPRLFQVDPSGAYFGWKATAIGKGYVNANNFLEKRYQEDMELKDAIPHGAADPEGGVRGGDERAQHRGGGREQERREVPAADPRADSGLSGRGKLRCFFCVYICSSEGGGMMNYWRGGEGRTRSIFNNTRDILLRRSGLAPIVHLVFGYRTFFLVMILSSQYISSITIIRSCRQCASVLPILGLRRTATL